jgi:hypothetical protein
MIILQKNSIKIGYKIKKFKFRNSAVVRMSLSREIRRHNNLQGILNTWNSKRRQMSKIQWVQHVAISSTLFLPAIYCAKQNTLSTLTFNIHLLWLNHVIFIFIKYNYYREIRRHNTGNSCHNQFKEKNCIKIGWKKNLYTLYCPNMMDHKVFFYYFISKKVLKRAKILKFRIFARHI